MKGMENWIIRMLVVFLTFSGAAWPSPLRAGQGVEELERRLGRLEEELRLLREELKALRSDGSERLRREEPGTEVQVGRRGFEARSADDNLHIRVRGYAQSDGRFYGDDADLGANHTFLVRRVRPILQVTARRDFELRIMPEFGGGSVTLLDAYVNWRIRPELQVLAGRLKSPTGLERLQSSSSLHFMERGLPTQLVPNRDVGLRIHGDVLDERLDYAIALVNGARDGGNVDVDGDDGKDVAVRLFAHPFRKISGTGLQGLGVGLAATRGIHRGATRGYSTAGQQTFFGFRPDVVNDGLLWRLTPQAYFYGGPLGLLGEWVVSSQQLHRGGMHRTIQNRAWQVAGVWVLTGEDASFTGVRPRRPLGGTLGGPGAFEVTGRVGQIRIDPDVFPLLADPESRASRATGLGLGLNWYLSSMVKWNFDYGTTRLSEPRFEVFPARTERTFFTRVQLQF